MSTPGAKRSKSRDLPKDLPEDAIREILLRLSVKILVRFKCVCKLWCTIIESQSFIEQHCHQRQERLLVRHYKPNDDNNAYAMFVDDTCSRFEEPAHLQMPDMLIDKLLGPVNGVFCLVDESGDVALLNPAMRQLKLLPKLPELIAEPHSRFVQNVVGFGLDPLSGDHKVVTLWYFLDDLGCHSNVFVYSLGCDSWRRLKDVCRFKSKYPNWSFCNTYLNGVYYWAMTCLSTNVATILAFDMTTEKFQEIQVPGCLKSKLWHLTIHGDSIALLSYKLGGVGLCEVWVMEKKGRCNKVAVVGPYQPVGRPLYLWKNNELLIKTDTSFLMLCNIFTKKRQLTQARARPESGFLGNIFSYKESLVSIKGEGDNCVLWDGFPVIITISWTKESN